MTIFNLTIPIDDDLRQVINTYLVSELGDDYHPDLIEIVIGQKTKQSEIINDLFCKAASGVEEGFTANILHSQFRTSLYNILGHMQYPIGFNPVRFLVHNLIYLSPNVDLLTVEMEVVANDY